MCKLVAVGVASVLAVSSAAASSAQEGTGAQSAYLVGPGDVLRVDAFQYDEISGEFPVEEGGAVTYPLLGNVAVAGLSVSEISRRLEQALEQDFYVDVQIHVEVAQYKSQPVTVLGEVARPGTYYLKGRTSLTQVLADAGGLKSTAGASLELRRVEIVDGREVHTVYNFSAAKVMSGEEGQEVEIRVGDVLSVPARQLFFITGEVARPGQYEIHPGLTLMQALSQAGGLGKFASQSIELHRDEGGTKNILNLDIADIRKGKQEDPAISTGDVIIVKRRFF